MLSRDPGIYFLLWISSSQWFFFHGPCLKSCLIDEETKVQSAWICKLCMLMDGTLQGELLWYAVCKQLQNRVPFWLNCSLWWMAFWSCYFGIALLLGVMIMRSTQSGSADSYFTYLVKWNMSKHLLNWGLQAVCTQLHMFCEFFFFFQRMYLREDRSSLN